MKKLILDCRLRGAPPTEALRRQVESLNKDLTKCKEKNKVEMNEVVKCREELWEAQKNCDKDRRE